MRVLFESKNKTLKIITAYTYRVKTIRTSNHPPPPPPPPLRLSKILKKKVK